MTARRPDKANDFRRAARAIGAERDLSATLPLALSGLLLLGLLLRLIGPWTV
jgi:hypothetical protein